MEPVIIVEQNGTTATAAIIAAIAAILAPVITALINNIHLSRMAKREIYIKRSIEVIEKYVANVGAESWSEFQEYSCLIFLHVPKKYWKDIEELNRLLLSRDISGGNEHIYAKSSELLAKVSQALSEYTEEIRK
jgi:hypothetical protein